MRHTKRLVVAQGDTAGCASLKNQQKTCLVQSVGITISCYQNEIPLFIESEMDRLYENFYSSLAQFKVYEKLENVNTYVVKKDDVVTVILLFRCKNKIVHVLNELIKIDEIEIDRFAKYIFEAFRFISVISFSAIETDIKNLPFLCQRYNFSEDLIVTLPKSPQEYLAALGNSTRRKIKYYIKKIKQQFPSFSYRFYEREAIDKQHILALVKLKLARMADKKKVSGVNESDIERIFKLVKTCGGLIGIATIDGHVCGGQISYRVGTNDFFSLISHDPKYNNFRLGTICCYLSICECINRRGTKCHFLWGREEYKYRLLGVQHDMGSLDIYRSYSAYFLNAAGIIKNVARSYAQRLKTWILDMERKNNFESKIAKKAIEWLRTIKRSMPNN
jgi:hypothetical protein